MYDINRRNFIKKTTLTGIGIGLTGSSFGFHTGIKDVEKGKRIGMIGLDTSHSVAFSRLLNDPEAGDAYKGYKVVAAYPNGTELVEVMKNRIPEFTERVENLGVEIVGSMKELLDKTDVILLTSVDGNVHLDYALQVYKTGKPVFIDKPLAGKLSDAFTIAEKAKEFNIPMFSSSSLRFIGGTQEIANGEIGIVTGADVFSPAHLEKNHSDLFWYGVHGVEILFTVMGMGCKSVTRTFTEGTDYVVGVWEDNRLGTYRGIRKGRGGYGGTVYGEKGILTLGKYEGYHPLLVKIVEFFETGIAPVSIEETLEMFAFMEAAAESRNKKGKSVDLETVIKKAKRK